MTLPIRPVTDEEYPAFVEAVYFQFGEAFHPDDLPAHRGLSELDRTRAVFDGDRIVGTAETLTFRMAVPGGRTVACGGLTSVGVHTTHRRQGLMTALVQEHFTDARRRGEPLSALYASEAPLYGRYGYGPAAPTIWFTVKGGRDRFAQPLEAVRRIRFGDAARDRVQLAAVYDAVHQQTPGCMSRSAAHWEYLIGTDEERHREGFGPRVIALLDDRGYVIYRLKPGWSDHAPSGELKVEELLARDEEAYAALWQLCCSVDLITTITAELRPPDEALPFLLTDASRWVAHGGDPLYVRLLDLPAALEGRGYAGTGTVVLDVADPLCPDNTGRWQLEAGPDGAACRRTTAEPDLELDARDLATAYLGGVRLARLARAGRVRAHTAGAVARADALFAADPLPWNPRIF